jgi:hypothetical protein
MSAASSSWAPPFASPLMSMSIVDVCKKQTNEKRKCKCGVVFECLDLSHAMLYNRWINPTMMLYVCCTLYPDGRKGLCCRCPVSV